MYKFRVLISIVIIQIILNNSTTAKEWKLVYHETFDTPFDEPSEWVEDTYGDDSEYHVGPFDEDGEFFHDNFGESFQTKLNSFRSFRKAYTYGEDDWLTVQLYGRDVDKDGTPESGGKFIAENGKAKLISFAHTDGAIITSTEELPKEYRVEVTISNINFGGEIDGSWYANGKQNGYDGGEMAGPWKPSSVSSVDENGVYFLCITDYSNPAPHNNVFIHHHRKVVMDSDNNNDNGYSWSKVWNPNTQKFERDGSHYVSMIWLNGESFGGTNSGNEFISYTPNGWEYTANFTDKYLDNETYTFAIERSNDSYTMSATGKFYYGGERTYSATRAFTDSPVIWHYNQNPEQNSSSQFNETKSWDGKSFETWPKNSFYPDHFFFGDPHINYYEGTAYYDDLKLFLPDTAVSNMKKKTNSKFYNREISSQKIKIGKTGEFILGFADVRQIKAVDLYSLKGRKVGHYKVEHNGKSVKLKNYKQMSRQFSVAKFFY